MLIKMAIIKRNRKSKLHVKWRAPAFNLVSQILGNNAQLFNNFLLAANREYVILNNTKKFRGFAVVRNKNGEVIVDLIGANTRPHKRPPAGQKGWGRSSCRLYEKTREGGPCEFTIQSGTLGDFMNTLGMQQRATHLEGRGLCVGGLPHHLHSLGFALYQKTDLTQEDRPADNRRDPRDLLQPERLLQDEDGQTRHEYGNGRGQGGHE